MGLQAKITSKGQLTLPVEIREQLGLKTGDHVEFYVGIKGEIRMRPRNMPATAVLDVLKPRKSRAQFKTDDDAIASAIVERDDRSRKAKGK